MVIKTAGKIEAALARVSPLITAALGAAAVCYIPVPFLRRLMALLCAAGAVFAAGRPAGRREVWIKHCAAAAAGAFIALAAGNRAAVFAPGLPPETMSAVQGVLLEDPRTAGASRQGMAALRLTKTEARLGSGTARASASGALTVFFSPLSAARIKEFGRGTEVYAEGAFLPPRDTGTPAFRARSIHTVNAAPPYERFRTALRARLLAAFDGADWGGLSAALLLGVRENLDGALAAAYRNAGLSHILALSGMHLAFLSGLLALLLRKPLGKRASIMAGLVFVFGYLLLIGPQPSLVRAALLYALGSVLLLGGHERATLPLLGACFMLQILLFPESGLSLSFILSYLALAGILILAPSVEELLKGRLPDSAAKALGASLGAFIFTAPPAAAVFGVLRPAGIIAGLLITPLSTAFMALSLGAFFPRSAFLGGPLSLLESVIRRCVNAAARFPGVGVSLPPALIFSAALAAALVLAAKRRRLRRSYLAPFD
ncbi:MAG: ComEC/Rec2 family competence protein [Treponema sp.]|jgi:competence protein ComEC|nr:ComEC/Rec2 family competence protein [Treponema sp.]